MKSRKLYKKSAPRVVGQIFSLSLLLPLLSNAAPFITATVSSASSPGSILQGTSVITGHFPNFVAIAADRGGRRRLGGSSNVENVDVCKIAAVGSRHLLSYTTVDIQADVNNPEDHLLKRAASIIKFAPDKEHIETTVWKIAESEANIAADWSRRDPTSFNRQPSDERGPSITVANVDDDGKINVFIIEIKVIEKADHKLFGQFDVKALQQGEVAFGAKAANARDELISGRTQRSQEDHKVLSSLLEAKTLSRFREAAVNFVDLTKIWYPNEVFGGTDFAVLTPAGIFWLGRHDGCE